jgi:superfamily I DNA/RNA helicase
LGASVVLETSQSFTTDRRTVVVTTPHSFKGYDAEVVFVAGADGFCAGGVLASTLYVALTRARSVLEIYCSDGRDEHGRTITAALDSVASDLMRADDYEP